jgi:hypothetical protein
VGNIKEKGLVNSVFCKKKTMYLAITALIQILFFYNEFLNNRTFRGRQLIVKLTRPPGPKCRGRPPFAANRTKPLTTKVEDIQCPGNFTLMFTRVIIATNC